MIITEQQKEIARWAKDYAIKQGCSQSRVSFLSALDNNFEYRNNQLDKLQQSVENKLFIELFVDGCYGSFSTNRLDKTELERFINEGIVSTKYLASDLCRKLPDPDRYYEGSEDLEQFDKSILDLKTEPKIDLVKATVDEVLGSDDRIISVTSSLYDGASGEYMIDSNGFEALSYDTACSLSAEVSMKTSTDARPEAYWSESEIYWDLLPKKSIANRALEMAKGKIDQQKIKSGQYNLILNNRLSARLLSPMISAILGRPLQQKNSFLLDKLGDKIASGILTLTDAPHLKRSFGARYFDGEGVATINRTIIDKGVLNTYFIDTYNSLKMGVSPTISSPSVVVAQHGVCNFDMMLRNMVNGIWVTNFNGGNCNPTTGDFSFGVEGFEIRNGLISQPVGEMNITGNMLDLWSHLHEVGNDSRPNKSWRIPSLMFTDVSFSGL